MSVEANAWVWTLRGLAWPERLVLLRLANHVRKDNNRARPSVKSIAEACEMGERTARRCLRKLEEAKHLSVESLGGGYKVTTVYALALPGYPATTVAGLSAPKPGQMGTRNPAKSSPFSPTTRPAVAGEREKRKGKEERVNPPTPRGAARPGGALACGA